MLSLLAISTGDIAWWLTWAVVAVLGLVALFYLAAPVLVYSLTRLNAGDVFSEIDVEQIRPEAHEYFARAGDELVTLGFQPWLTLELRGYIQGPSGGQAAGMVYADPTRRTLALVSALFQPTSDGEKILRQTEFSSEGPDGLEYNTTNAEGMAEDVPDRKVVTVQARGTHDLGRLHAIHGELCKGVQLRPLPEQNDLIVVLNNQLRGKLKRREDAGILRRESDGVTYRPTMWGAYVMTWRVLPPHTWMYWRRHRVAVRKLERSAGWVGAR